VAVLLQLFAKEVTLLAIRWSYLLAFIPQYHKKASRF